MVISLETKFAIKSGFFFFYLATGIVQLATGIVIETQLAAVDKTRLMIWTGSVLIAAGVAGLVGVHNGRKNPSKIKVVFLLIVSACVCVVSSIGLALMELLENPARDAFWQKSQDTRQLNELIQVLSVGTVAVAIAMSFCGLQYAFFVLLPRRGADSFRVKVARERREKATLRDKMNIANLKYTEATPQIKADGISLRKWSSKDFATVSRPSLNMMGQLDGSAYSDDPRRITFPLSTFKAQDLDIAFNATIATEPTYDRRSKIMSRPTRDSFRDTALDSDFSSCPSSIPGSSSSPPLVNTDHSPSDPSNESVFVDAAATLDLQTASTVKQQRPTAPPPPPPTQRLAPTASRGAYERVSSSGGRSHGNAAVSRRVQRAQATMSCARPADPPPSPPRPPTPRHQATTTTTTKMTPSTISLITLSNKSRYYGQRSPEDVHVPVSDLLVLDGSARDDGSSIVADTKERKPAVPPKPVTLLKKNAASANDTPQISHIDIRPQNLAQLEHFE